MSAEKITIYQGRKKVINCTVSGLSDLTEYSAQMVALKPDGTELFDKEGGIAGLTVTTTLNPTDTKDLKVGIYPYQIDIWNGTNVYTVQEGEVEVKKAHEKEPS